MTSALFLNQKEYPSLLANIYDPPKKLYYKGNLACLKKTCIAVVGTRRNSEYGEFYTKKIVAELSVYDVAIVSGLALGIDTIAHTTAIKQNLPTVAVLGSGLDNIYPRQNQTLSEKILSHGGLLLSEYADNEEAIKFHFPQRNRIISGLSVATIVTEAPEKSGALITASLALEQGRDIFTIPQDLERPESRGALYLLQNTSAYPISSAKDVINYLSIQTEFKPIAQKPAAQKPVKIDHKVSSIGREILQHLSSERARSFEKILKNIPIPPQELLSELSFLEVDGLVKISNGKILKTC